MFNFLVSSTYHVTNNVKVREDLEINFWAKNASCAWYPREKYWQSIICSKHPLGLELLTSSKQGLSVNFRRYAERLHAESRPATEGNKSRNLWFLSLPSSLSHTKETLQNKPSETKIKWNLTSGQLEGNVPLFNKQWLKKCNKLYYAKL